MENTHPHVIWANQIKEDCGLDIPIHKIRKNWEKFSKTKNTSWFNHQLLAREEIREILKTMDKPDTEVRVLSNVVDKDSPIFQKAVQEEVNESLMFVFDELRSLVINGDSDLGKKIADHLLKKLRERA